jgi:hypothetical protein
LLKKLYISLFVDDLIESSGNSIPVKAEPLKKKLMRDLARLTLFSYILLVFNPVMPVIADKMAHTFWEEYHLVTVHGVYGNFHVHMQLADNAKQADKDKSAPGSSKSGSDEYFHIIPATLYNFLSVCSISKSYPPNKFYSPVSYQDVDYQPPKV